MAKLEANQPKRMQKPARGKSTRAPPAVEQHAQEGRGQRSDKAGHRENRRRVRGAALEIYQQGVVVNRFAVFGAALYGKVAQGEHEDCPTVMEAGPCSFQHEGHGQHEGRWSRRQVGVGRSTRRLYTPDMGVGPVPSASWIERGERHFTSMNRMGRILGRGLFCHCDPVLDAGVGNLGTVAMVVCRRALNLNEIATSLRSS